MTSETTRSKAFPAELRERAVRLVCEQEGEHANRGAAVRSVAAKLGYHTETLWLRDAERDARPTREEQARLEALEREVREFRQAGEIRRHGLTPGIGRFRPGGAQIRVEPRRGKP